MSSPVPKQGMQIDISTMQVTEKDIEKNTKNYCKMACYINWTCKTHLKMTAELA